MGDPTAALTPSQLSSSRFPEPRRGVSPIARGDFKEEKYSPSPQIQAFIAGFVSSRKGGRPAAGGGLVLLQSMLFSGKRRQAGGGGPQGRWLGPATAS